MTQIELLSDHCWHDIDDLVEESHDDDEIPAVVDVAKDRYQMVSLQSVLVVVDKLSKENHQEDVNVDELNQSDIHMQQIRLSNKAKQFRVPIANNDYKTKCWRLLVSKYIL